jgi:toxin ParE1/3/4
MTRVVISGKARGDFREIIAYLTHYAGPLIAKRYAADIDDCLTLIAEHPGIGAPRPELGLDIRIRMVRPYVVIYAYSGEAVEILRILHGKRNINSRRVQR